MAVDYSITPTYVGRVTAPTAQYPFGSSKPLSGPGIPDGSPWDVTRGNDEMGFWAACLTQGGITPNGNPDNAQVSQYLEGIVNTVARSSLVVDIYCGPVATGNGLGTDASNEASYQSVFYDGLLTNQGVYNVIMSTDTLNGTGSVLIENADVSITNPGVTLTVSDDITISKGSFAIFTKAVDASGQTVTVTVNSKFRVNQDFTCGDLNVFENGYAVFFDPVTCGDLTVRQGGTMIANDAVTSTEDVRIGNGSLLNCTGFLLTVADEVEVDENSTLSANGIIAGGQITCDDHSKLRSLGTITWGIGESLRASDHGHIDISGSISVTGDKDITLDTSSSLNCDGDITYGVGDNDISVLRNSSFRCGAIDGVDNLLVSESSSLSSAEITTAAMTADYNSSIKCGWIVSGTTRCAQDSSIFSDGTTNSTFGATTITLNSILEVAGVGTVTFAGGLDILHSSTYSVAGITTISSGGFDVINCSAINAGNNIEVTSGDSTIANNSIVRTNNQLLHDNSNLVLTYNSSLKIEGTRLECQDLTLDHSCAVSGGPNTLFAARDFNLDNGSTFDVNASLWVVNITGNVDIGGGSNFKLLADQLNVTTGNVDIGGSSNFEVDTSVGGFPTDIAGYLCVCEGSTANFKEDFEVDTLTLLDGGKIISEGDITVNSANVDSINVRRSSHITMLSNDNSSVTGGITVEEGSSIANLGTGTINHAGTGNLEAATFSWIKGTFSPATL